jgi:ubiquinone/menaquinone biosynthesis C-methylase UbiE
MSGTHSNNRPPQDHPATCPQPPSPELSTKKPCDSADRGVNEARFWNTQVAEGNGFRSLFYGEVNNHLWKLMLPLLGPLESRRLLFVGCGTASVVAKRLAVLGAEVWCLDISEGSLKQLLRHPFGSLQSVIHPVVADAEQTPFTDGYFHVVLGKAIVHHLDTARFMKEVRRICVPNGQIVFSEPLGMNPLINLFRRLTPAARVPTEHPFKIADVRIIRKHCESLREYYSFLFAMFSLPWFAFGLGSAGRFFFRIGSWLDRVCFCVFPPAKWLAWNVTFSGRLGAYSQKCRQDAVSEQDVSDLAKEE